MAPPVNLKLFNVRCSFHCIDLLSNVSLFLFSFEPGHQGGPSSMSSSHHHHHPKSSSATTKDPSFFPALYEDEQLDLTGGINNVWGGIPAKNHRGENLLLFIGMIDILQVLNRVHSVQIDIFARNTVGNNNPMMALILAISRAHPGR